MENPSFDEQAAHRHFAAFCFNKTWEWIDKANRSPQEDRAMLEEAMASLWHWSQRADAAKVNLSVGNWQVSRVYALLGQAEQAREYAQVALQYADGAPPFYSAFAYEALARAEKAAQNKNLMLEYLNKARLLAEQVTDEEDRKVLMDDLKSLE